MVSRRGWRRSNEVLLPVGQGFTLKKKAQTSKTGPVKKPVRGENRLKGLCAHGEKKLEGLVTALSVGSFSGV